MATLRKREEDAILEGLVAGTYQMYGRTPTAVEQRAILAWATSIITARSYINKLLAGDTSVCATAEAQGAWRFLERPRSLQTKRAS